MLIPKFKLRIIDISIIKISLTIPLATKTSVNTTAFFSKKFLKEKVIYTYTLTFLCEQIQKKERTIWAFYLGLAFGWKTT